MSIDQSASPVSSAASAGIKLANWATNGIPALRGSVLLHSRAGFSRQENRRSSVPPLSCFFLY